MKAKQIISLALALSMLFSMAVSVSAAEITNTSAPSTNTTVTYGAAESYLVTIPDSAHIGSDGLGVINVSLSNAMLPSQAALTVYMSGASYANNYWHLTETSNAENKLAYTIKKNGSALANNAAILVVAAGEAWNRTVTATLNLELVGEASQAGSYSDQLTFTVSRGEDTNADIRGTYTIDARKAMDNAIPVSLNMSDGMSEEELFAVFAEAMTPYLFPIKELDIFDWYYVNSTLSFTRMRVTAITPLINLTVENAGTGFAFGVLADVYDEGNNHLYQMIVPFELPDEEWMEYTLQNLYIGIETNDGVSDELRTLVTTVSNKIDNTPHSMCSTCVMYGNGIASFNVLTDMTWADFAQTTLAQAQGIRISGDYVIYGEADANGMYNALAINGVPVNVNDMAQCAVYDVVKLDASEVALGTVHMLNANMTAVTIPGINIEDYIALDSPGGNIGAYDVEVILPYIEPYFINGMVPTTYQGATIIDNISIAVKGEQDEHAYIFMYVGGVLMYTRTDSILCNWVRCFSLEDIERPAVVETWIAQNTTLRAEGKVYYDGVAGWVSQGDEGLILALTHYVSADKNMTWAELCAISDAYYINEYNEVCINTYVGITDWHPGDVILTARNTYNAVRPTDTVITADGQGYVAGLVRTEENEILYRCPHCTQLWHTPAQDTCDNDSCTITEAHSDCCCNTFEFNVMTVAWGAELRAEPNTTWRDWVETHHNYYGFGIDGDRVYWTTDGGTRMYLQYNDGTMENDYTKTWVHPDDIIADVDYTYTELD